MDDIDIVDSNLGFNVTDALSNSKSGLLSLLKIFEYKSVAFIPGLAESPSEKLNRLNSLQINDNENIKKVSKLSDNINLSSSLILNEVKSQHNVITNSKIHIRRSISDTDLNVIENGIKDDVSCDIQQSNNSIKSIYSSPNDINHENCNGKHKSTYKHPKSDYGKLVSNRSKEHDNHNSKQYKQQLSSHLDLPSTVLSSPLPLMNFSSLKLKQDIIAKTINRQEVRAIPNLVTKSSCILQQQDINEKLCDPILSRKISKWFVARSFKEYNWKQNELYGNSYSEAIQSVDNHNVNQSKVNISYIEVYESYLYLESNESKLERDNKRYLIPEDSLFLEHWMKLNATNTAISSSIGSCINFKDESSIDYMNYTTSIQFDGEFESGNLEKSTRILGRDSIMNSRSLEVLQDYLVPNNVDQEYDLIVRKDLNTNGNIQWYYFCVTCPTITNTDSRDNFSSPEIRMKYPLRVRFNIINMQKNDSLYNYGMKPAIYSENQLNNEDWIHSGEDVCYYRNGLTNIKGRGKKKLSVKHQYTLTFTYTFTQPDTVYFAHTFPYTYTDLQNYLNTMENCPRTSRFFHRRTLSSTLAGNLCDIITITERSKDILVSKQKPSIILTSRVHPGESNSSFMMQGFLDFITSDDIEAIKLRKAFVFSIVPMLNPDGVIHGNYRSSLAGTDLNRRFLNPHPILHPTVTALKNFLNSIHQKRSIYLYLDLHGHSKLKNSFLYGCDFTLQPDKITKHVISQLNSDEINTRKIFARVFPKILCEISNSNRDGYFSYRDSSFTMDKSKFGTGRIVGWNDISIPASYTIEASFCGNGDNNESKLFKKTNNHHINNNNIHNNNHIHNNNNNNSNNYNKTNNCHGIAYNQQSMNKSKSSKIKYKNKNSSNENTIGSINKENNEISTSINTLLDKYKNYVHYQKDDLLNMGRDIARAIYHFGNLSHYKETESISNANTGDSNTPRRSSLLLKLRNSQLSSSSSSLNKESMNCKDTNKSITIDTTFTTINTTDDDDLTDINVHDEHSMNDESDSDSANEQSSITIKAQEGLMDNTEIIERIKNIRRCEVNYLDNDMVNEFITKPGVYTTASIESIINKYPLEFENISLHTTKNVSMRMKCEYHIRRGLHLDHDIKLENNINLDNIEITEENLSMNGSESDPSQDNAPTSKMLKNLNKYKNTTNLVLALKNIIFHKKKKDEIKLSKIKVQNAKLIVKQLSYARKTAEEVELLTNKELLEKNKISLNEALDKQNQYNNNEKIRKNSIYAFGSSAIIDKLTNNNKEKFEKVYTNRKTSIYESTSRKLPIVKHELEEVNKDMKTIQLKIVNFQQNPHNENKFFQSKSNRLNDIKTDNILIIIKNNITIANDDHISNKNSLLHSTGLFTLPDIDILNNIDNTKTFTTNYISEIADNNYLKIPKVRPQSGGILYTPKNRNLSI